MLTKRTTFPVYEYKVICWTGDGCTIDKLNDLAKEGWEVRSTEFDKGTTNGYLLHRLIGWEGALDPAILEQATKEWYAARKVKERRLGIGIRSRGREVIND